MGKNYRKAEEVKKEAKKGKHPARRSLETTPGGVPKLQAWTLASNPA
jgi:hypothetical protein